MSGVGFFTAIKYTHPVKTRAQSALENVDNYFYLGGKKAHVIQEEGKEKVVLSQPNSSSLAKFGKCCSYFTIIIPLIMLITKAVQRSTHHFCLIDPKQKLEEGIHVPENTTTKIQELMPQILNAEKDYRIEWLSTNNLVFKLRDTPNLIFKIARPDQFHPDNKLPTYSNDRLSRTESRFKDMIKAKEVCLANHLNLLTLPHAKKLTIKHQENTYTFVVEEALNFKTKTSQQEYSYSTGSKELDEPIRQLALFTARTRFKDVVPRNIPILDESSQDNSSKHIGLVDVENLNTDDNVGGFIGSTNRSCGLIGCVSKNHIDAVIKEARKQGVPISYNQAKKAKNRRLQEIYADERLQQFYQKNNIKIGNERLQVDEDRIHFFYHSIPIAKKLRDLTIALIKELNKEVAKSSPEDSVKGRRSIYISTCTPGSPFYKKNKLIDKNAKYRTDQELYNATYMGQAVKRLVELGVIHTGENIHGNGYLIQA